MSHTSYQFLGGSIEPGNPFFQFPSELSDKRRRLQTYLKGNQGLIIPFKMDNNSNSSKRILIHNLLSKCYDTFPIISSLDCLLHTFRTDLRLQLHCFCLNFQNLFWNEICPVLLSEISQVVRSIAEVLFARPKEF